MNDPFYWFFDGRPGIEFQKFFLGKNRNDEVPRLGGVKGAIKESTPVLFISLHLANLTC